MRIKVLNAKRDSNFFSLPQFFSAFKLKDVKDQPLPQSPVFRKADKAIYWIMQLVSLILIRWIVIYPIRWIVIYPTFVTRLVQDGDRKCFMLLWMVTQRVRLERQWIISKLLFVQTVFFFHAVWLSSKKNVRIPWRPYKSHPPSTSLLLFQFSVFLFLFWVITICGLFLWPCHFRSNLLVSGLLASVFSILLISWVAICRSEKAILTMAWIYYKDQIFFLFLFNLSVPVSLKIQ